MLRPFARSLRIQLQNNSQTLDKFDAMEEERWILKQREFKF